MAQAELRETRTRRQAQKPDYVYYTQESEASRFQPSSQEILTAIMVGLTRMSTNSGSKMMRSSRMMRSRRSRAAGELLLLHGGRRGQRR